MPALSDFLLWVALSAVPLVFLPGIADEFRLPKLAAAELLLGLTCLALVLRGAMRMVERQRAYLWATVPFVAVAFASVVVGDHGDHGRIALWSLLFAWLVGLCWSGADLTLERLLWLMTPAAVFVAVLAIAQSLGWWSPFAIEESRRRLQVTSTVGNSGELASYLVLPAVFAAWRSLLAWNRGEGSRTRFGWPVVFLVTTAAITVTQTATALLLVAAVGAGLVATQPRRPAVRIGLLGAAALSVVALLLTPAASRVTEKLGELARGEWASLTTGRTDGWMVANQLLSEHPILGVGFGGFAAEFTTTKLQMAEQGVQFFTNHVGMSTFGNAHSEPLEVAAEMGALGLLALLWLSVMVIRPQVQAWRTREGPMVRESLLLRGAVLLAMAGLLVTYFPMRTALLGYPFLLCFVAMLSPPSEPSGPDQSGDPAAVQGAVPKGRRKWLLAVVILLLLVQSGRVSWLRIRSSAELRGAESMAQSMIQGGRVYPTVLRRLIPNLERAFENTPWDERLPQALAGYYVLLREGEKAKAWYGRSFEVAYRPETIDSMGRLLHSAGQVEESVPWFVQAVRLDRLRIRSVPSDVRSRVRQLAAAPAGREDQP